MRKDNRLVARASTEVHQVVNQAADLLGSTISQFLIDAAVEKATRVIEQSTKIALSQQQAELVFSLLDEPGLPNEKLLDAIEMYKKTELYDTKNRTH